MRNPYFALLRTAWQYASNRKRRFVLVYFMFVIANIIVALNPILYGWFVNDLQHKGTDALATGWVYVACFLGLRLAEWAFHGPARVMERKLAFGIGKNYLESLYTKVLHLPVQWHQENHSGATISKLRKAHEALREFFQNGFIYLYSFGKFVFSFAAMLYFSPLFGSIGIVLGVITIFIIMKFDKPFIRTLKDVNEKENEVSSTLFDSLSNILTVVTLRLEKSMKVGFVNKLMQVYPPFRKNVKINEWKWFIAQMMVGLIYAVITIGYIYQHTVPGETFMIGGLIILLGYVNQFTSVFNDIASQYTQIVKFDTEVQNVKSIEAAASASQSILSERRLPELWKTIHISNLNFTRPEVSGGGKPAGIFDLSMQINKGTKIALIGESGSGKSTLLSLLRGLYKPKAGTSASVGNYGEVSFEEISAGVMLFPQEPEIFENSVRYNLTLGIPFTDEQVQSACEAAQLIPVLDKLPQGLETYLHEKGANLSGGQKQRLALARGILAAKSNDIILMDEPTSSVDPKTELQLYKNLFATFSEKAVVSSLHRLHLLPLFDYIYILKNGAVVDEGTFEDLARYSLVFKEMTAHQNIDSVTVEETFAPLNVAL
jgi:ABC-type multidrug transport system fused ATPase/permease subunit